MLQLNTNYNYCSKKSLYFEQHLEISSFYSSESWIVLTEIEQHIKSKIESKGTPLKEWKINIYRGILTGYNEAFIIDGKKKEELIKEDSKSAEIIRPILRGRDIKKYKSVFADLWLINTHNGVKEKGRKPIDINNYPAIKKHLDGYYPKLKIRVDKGDSPYNLRNCTYIEDFFKPKIIFQEMVQEPNFMLDKEGLFMCLDTARIIVGDNLNILLAVMNSNLFFYSVKTFYGGGGLGENGVRMKHTFFENYSMPAFSEEDIIKIEKQMEDPIQNIIQINKMIYEHYGLNKDEIEFIEFQ